MRKVKYNNSEVPYFKLIIGCGNDKREGWIGMDKADYGQEIVWDLRWGIPLPDNSVEEIWADQVLEHIQMNEDYILVMNECLRVLKDGGKMEIQVPLWANEVAFKDPTHCRYFTKQSFSYLEKENGWKYGFDKKWKVESSEILGDSQVRATLIAEKNDKKTNKKVPK